MTPASRQPGSSAAELEDDLSLARRCALELKAREELFRLHAPLVFRLARRLLGNTADAEDVVQDVFIDVFASIARYRGEAPLRSWIYRIAVRRALRQRRRPAPVPLGLTGGEHTATDGVATLDGRALLQRVTALLAQLSADRRAIFILHEVEGFSLPEASALLGISLTAAKKRVWRARRELERLARGDPALRALFSVERGPGAGG